MSRKKKSKVQAAKNLYPQSVRGMRVALTRSRNDLGKARLEVARLRQFTAEIAASIKAAAQVANKAAKF